MASSGAKKKGGIGIRGPEHLSLGGLRADGRLPAEARTMVISLGVLPHADGSAAIRQGNTWVLASVSGPHDERGGGGGGGAGGSGGGTTTTATGVPQGAHTEDAGLVRCTVTTARFSTPAGRKPSVRGSGDVVSADVDGKMASVGVLAEGLDAASVGAEQAAFAMREALRKYTLGLIDARGHVAF